MPECTGGGGGGVWGGGGGSGNRGYTLLAAVVREENRVGTRVKVREGWGGEGKGLSRTGILYKNTDGRFVASNTPTVDSLYRCLTLPPTLPPPPSHRCRVSCALPIPLPTTLCHRLRASLLLPSPSLSLFLFRYESGSKRVKRALPPLSPLPRCTLRGLRV